MIIELKKGAFQSITKDFNSTEFDCHCARCDTTYIDTDLVNKLQKKRDEIGKPIEIVSGFRCVSHNKSVGGKIGSMHLTGKAADIAVNGMSHHDLQTHMQDFDGLGCGANITHVDVRGYKARWTY